MSLRWKSDFDMEFPGRTPEDLAVLSRRRPFVDPSGLWVRVKRERLRARRMYGPSPVNTPLLTGRLVATATGARLVGRIHWAAPLILRATVIGFCLLIGVSSLVPGKQDLPPAIVDVPLLLFAGWFTYHQVRHAEEIRKRHEAGFRTELHAAFDREPSNRGHG